MGEELIKIKNDASSLIIDAETTEELNLVKLEFLGKSGRLTLSTKELGKLPEDRRPEIGKLANEIKNTLESLLESKAKELIAVSQQKKNQKREKIDVTLPGETKSLGHLHLITQAIEEISEIFDKIGFRRRRYPEVEWDWYAFEALNFPENHPARDDWETFFVEEESDPKYGPMLLTPHATSGQIREMEISKPPFRIINIEKTYRRQSDISHTAMFHQFDTVCIGENINITHLKGTLEYFVKSWFGENRKSRIRPYHFQFTEPSFETDVTCGVCNGTGKLQNGEKCKLCKEGWLEMGGAGMIHPNVLKAVGIDPEKYSGFASGWGVERVLMMREGFELDDLRMIYSNDLEFLEQF